jgi:hypothetical protein
MSTADVTKILERLAVIETKLDAQSQMTTRVRRLELVIVAIVAALGIDAAGISLPL